MKPSTCVTTHQSVIVVTVLPLAVLVPTMTLHVSVLTILSMMEPVDVCQLQQQRLQPQLQQQQQQQQPQQPQQQLQQQLLPWHVQMPPQLGIVPY